MPVVRLLPVEGIALCPSRKSILLHHRIRNLSRCGASCIEWLACGLIMDVGPVTGRKSIYKNPVMLPKQKGAKRMASPFYTAEHEAYREVVRRFVEKEIEPYAHEWDEAGGFPRVLYEKAAQIGLLGLGFPQGYRAPPLHKFPLVLPSP